MDLINFYSVVLNIPLCGEYLTQNATQVE